MGLFTLLLRLHPDDLKGISRQSLYKRFHMADGFKSDDVLNIDKSREGIVYLLKDKHIQHAISGPGEKSFSGEKLVFPDDDNDSIVYWVLTPEEVKRLSKQLAEINSIELQNNFDPWLMMDLDIYPYTWDRGNEAYDYLRSHLFAIKNFISLAALSSMAVVIVTT